MKRNIFYCLIVLFFSLPLYSKVIDGFSGEISYTNYKYSNIKPIVSNNINILYGYNLLNGLLGVKLGSGVEFLKEDLLPPLGPSKAGYKDYKNHYNIPLFISLQSTPSLSNTFNLLFSLDLGKRFFCNTKSSQGPIKPMIITPKVGVAIHFGKSKKNAVNIYLNYNLIKKPEYKNNMNAFGAGVGFSF